MRLKQPWILLVIPALWVFIIGSIVGGIIYTRTRAIYEATDPDGFWHMIYYHGFFSLFPIVFFLLAQIGDGWNEDGE